MICGEKIRAVLQACNFSHTIVWAVEGIDRSLIDRISVIDDASADPAQQA